MGKKSGPQPQAAPDPAKVAEAQTGSNIGTAIAQAAIGNANVVGPTGSTNYNITGNTKWTDPSSGRVYEIPQYTQTTTLSPEQQSLYNQQTQLGGQLNQLALDQTGRLTDHLGKPIDTSTLPQRGEMPTTDFSADRARVEEAMFNRINPQLERDRASLETNLVNQGFQRGTEAFNQAMGDHGRNVNDARLAITERGLGEQQGLYGMGLQTAQFNNQNRQQALQESLALRNQPINEISALMSGGQVSLPNAPQYNAPNVANTPIGEYMYNSAALDQNNYKMQQQQRQAQLDGLYKLGGTAIQAATWMSDRRLKRDIIDLGVRLMSGLRLYAYRYFWDDVARVGVMADEVATVRPDAVVPVGGFLAVNYGAL
jgi:hypothetical protein